MNLLGPLCVSTPQQPLVRQQRLKREDPGQFLKEAVAIMLREARRMGRLPYLTREDIAEQLKSVRQDRTLPEYLRPAEVRALLEAALRHDAEELRTTITSIEGRLSETGPQEG